MNHNDEWWKRCSNALETHIFVWIHACIPSHVFFSSLLHLKRYFLMEYLNSYGSSACIVLKLVFLINHLALLPSNWHSQRELKQNQNQMKSCASITFNVFIGAYLCINMFLISLELECWVVTFIHFQSNEIDILLLSFRSLVMNLYFINIHINFHKSSFGTVISRHSSESCFGNALINRSNLMRKIS